CWPAPRAASATCSRTGWPTWTTSSPRCARGSRAGGCSTPRGSPSGGRAGGGACYLLKDRVAGVDDFVAALRQVIAGGTVLDPEVVAQLMSRRDGEPVERLTPREQEVLALMAGGRSNAAIAGRLFITEKAVAKHINNIF